MKISNFWSESGGDKLYIFLAEWLLFPQFLPILGWGRADIICKQLGTDWREGGYEGVWVMPDF